MTNKKTSVKSQELDKLNLGKKTYYPTGYSAKILEYVSTSNTSDAWASFICSEFTSLCPKTSQPDFAKIFINYIADNRIIESKSLKLYLFSFRNHGSFHEDCIQTICNDIQELINPKYLEVIGEFTPRGGIAIFPYSQACNNTKKFNNLKEARFNNYSPTKYSMSLSNLY